LWAWYILIKQYGFVSLPSSLLSSQERQHAFNSKRQGPAPVRQDADLSQGWHDKSKKDNTNSYVPPRNPGIVF
jgi:hypothetical protein